MNEKKLAARLSRGDTEALRAIIEQYSGYVRTVARNFSRGILAPQDIDDITADVFFGLWEARGTLDADIGIRPYLSASARNAVKDRFKRRLLPPENIEELEIPDDFSVETTAELHEMFRVMQEGLDLLPRRESDIFFRFYFYGERSGQIAKSMGMTESAVNTSLSRTRKKLREYLTERGCNYV